MSVELSRHEGAGIYVSRIDGAISRTDIASAAANVMALARSGDMRGIIVDARESELVTASSLAREMWEDSLSLVPEHMPVAYVGRPDVIALREPQIRPLLDAWDTPVELFTDFDKAVDWVNARLPYHAL